MAWRRVQLARSATYPGQPGIDPLVYQTAGLHAVVGVVLVAAEGPEPGCRDHRLAPDAALEPGERRPARARPSASGPPARRSSRSDRSPANA
jgi:hypothetical protein